MKSFLTVALTAILTACGTAEQDSTPASVPLVAPEGSKVVSYTYCSGSAVFQQLPMYVSSECEGFAKSEGQVVVPAEYELAESHVGYKIGLMQDAGNYSYRITLKAPRVSFANDALVVNWD